MKVKIIKKSIKEGVDKNGNPYCIKSLYACVDNKDDANQLALKAMEIGATKEQIETLIRKSDKNENEFAFGLNCSEFTFNKVQQYGILDAEIIYTKSPGGYISAKIQVIDRKEQIKGYIPGEEEVTGWASDVQPTANTEPQPTAPVQPVNNESVSGLPF